MQWLRDLLCMRMKNKIPLTIEYFGQTKLNVGLNLAIRFINGVK